MSKAISSLTCPSCKRLFALEPRRSTMPFCSQQCQMIDLGRWMNEEISIPHDSTDEEPEIEAPPIVREWRFD